MKTLSTLLLLLGHVFWVSDVAAFLNEPPGFQGMQWGTPLGTLFSEDEFVGYSSDEKSSRFQKTGESTPLEIDYVKVYGMVFSFYDGKFWKVELEARLLQAGKLLNLFIAKYGEPSRVSSVSEYTKEYVWSGNSADIVLTASLNFYDRATVDIASASIYSREIRSAIDTDGDPVLPEHLLPIDAIDGFRNRKWGSGFIKGVTYLPLEREPHHVYLIKGDDMVFEGVYSREIRYRFYNNRALQKVELYFSGQQNYLKLKEACFRLFGTTSRYEQGDIRWIGKKTTARLSFTVDANGTWTSRLDLFGFGRQ